MPEEGTPSEWCQAYWSEALNPANAYKRNEAWKNVCYLQLAQRIEETNEYFGEAIYYEDAPRNTINQYVRVMNWMDISVEELLRMDETPYELMMRLSKMYSNDVNNEHDYLYTSGYPNREDDLDKEELEWFGVLNVWWYQVDPDTDACGKYYPQLFFNRWIPLDPEEYGLGDATPAPLPDVVSQGPNRVLFVPEKYVRD